jgi:hypothetical protein
MSRSKIMAQYTRSPTSTADPGDQRFDGASGERVIVMVCRYAQRRRGSTLAVLLVMLGCESARAEFLRIEQSLASLDCASCAESLATRMKRLRGVESAATTPDGFVRIELKPDNTVRLETVRDLVKGGGFTPHEARVRVRGTAVETGGRWEFQVTGLDQSYPLERSPDLGPLRSGQRIVAEAVVLAPTAPRVTPALRLTAFEPDR